jgi:toxin ParE1/3/4
MNHYITVTGDANYDLEQARVWYNERQQGLGERFILAARQRFEIILRWPELPRAFGRKAVRKVRIPRSPYSIYYRVLGQKIQIVAIVHGSRDPDYLNYRLR